MEQLGSHGTDFHEIWYLSIFQKYVEKIQVSLNSDKNNGYFTWGSIYIFDPLSLHSSQNEKWSDTSCTENQNARMFSNFLFEYRAVWDNVENYIIVDPERPQTTILRVRFACWITKATHMHTHSECVILTALLLTQWFRERVPNVTLHLYCLSCFKLNLQDCSISGYLKQLEQHI